MNSIWIKYNKINDTDGIVTRINYVPNDETYGVAVAELATGIFVDSIPEPDPTQATKGHELHINPQTSELYYVYFDIPTEQLPPEARIAQLEKDKVDLQTQLNNAQGALDDFFLNVLPTLQTKIA